MLRSAGLQLPLENTFISSDNSIAYSAENVKTYGGTLDNFVKIEYNNTSSRKPAEQTVRTVERPDELYSRSRASSDEVAVYSSECAMELI